MKHFAKFIFCILIVLYYSSKINAKNTWLLNKELSEITFELPVILAKKIKGNFADFEGYIVIDEENKENNRALFSVKINSIKLNYSKYKELLLSKIFFNESSFPIAITDTKRFAIPSNSKIFQINVELQIKDILHTIPLMVEIIYLANDLTQVKANFKFSRTDYELGKESWSSTILLRDIIYVKTNLFFMKE